MSLYSEKPFPGPPSSASSSGLEDQSRLRLVALIRDPSRSPLSHAFSFRSFSRSLHVADGHSFCRTASRCPRSIAFLYNYRLHTQDLSGIEPLVHGRWKKWKKIIDDERTVLELALKIWWQSTVRSVCSKIHAVSNFDADAPRNTSRPRMAFCSVMFTTEVRVFLIGRFAGFISRSELIRDVLHSRIASRRPRSAQRIHLVTY